MRMTKVVLALGMMTAAGSSGAFYLTSGGLHQLPKDGYCASLWFRGNTGIGVMDTTALGCQTQLTNETTAAQTAGKQIIAVQPCGLCVQKFATVPVTAYVLPEPVVREYLEGTKALREEFRIDDYERAQEEFERSLATEHKP